METKESKEILLNEELKKMVDEFLTKAFGWGVQATLDMLLIRGHNTRKMMCEISCGKDLYQDLQEAQKQAVDTLKELFNKKIQTTFINAEVIKR